MSFDLNYWTTAKYRYSFTDERGDSRTVEIHKFGYDNGGAPLWANITDVEANGRGSVGTRWTLSGDDEYSPFMESETTFKLYDTGEALATDLLDEINEVRDKFLLLVREGDDIKWIEKFDELKKWMATEPDNYEKLQNSFIEFNSKIEKLEIEEGDLLIFPAYLPHGVEENKSNEDRIVISFNIIINNFKI